MTVPATWDVEIDVVVVGAGACGFAAALTVADRGYQVLLLEKTSRPGGNTELSAGFIPAAGTRYQAAAGIQDSPNLMAEDILRKNGRTSDEKLTHLLCRQSADVVHWITDRVGLELQLATDFLYSGQSTYRFHHPPSRSGRELISAFEEAVRSTPGVTFVTDTPVAGLIASPAGEVLGVWAGAEPQDDGSVPHGAESIRARKVILANNGFAGNRDMVARYCPAIAGALYFGARGNTGDGIRWGMALGADVAHMGAFQGHGSVAYPHGMLVTWALLEKGGFLANRRGERFGNENRGYSPFAVMVRRQPDGLAWDVFDQKIYDDMKRNDPNFAEIEESGAIRRGDSAEELARRLGIDEHGLARTLAAYNKAAAGEEPDPLGRTSFGGSPLRPPFYGIQVTAALFHTQGGLRINEWAQPLTREGRPIPNLFAGGGVAVGISGPGDDGYSPGNGLLTALGWGRIAGETAARQMTINV